MDCIIKSDVNLQQSIMQVVKVWARCRSKDPTRKVGAAVYYNKTGGLFLGYNGFPRGIDDLSSTWNARVATTREDITKHDLMVHAEINAVRKALSAGCDLSQCDLYCTHHPCSNCMRDAVAINGVRMVYFGDESIPARYNKRSRYIAQFIADKCGITLTRITL